MSQIYNTPPQWVWDPSQQQYFYLEPSTDTLWYQDGRKVPRQEYSNAGPSRMSAVSQYPRQYTHSSNYTTQVTDSVSSSLAQLNIQGSGTEQERLAPSFKRQRAGFFILGRVFLALWSEPAAGNSSYSSITLTRLGENVFTNIRRFVVIREGNSYCTAIPILTYGGRGVAKTGVNPKEHSIVYSGTSPPMSQTGEQSLMPEAIRVVPDSPTDKLDPASRINYGKVYTIEHTLKVKAFGMVHHRSMAALLSQFATTHGMSSRSQRPASEVATVVPDQSPRTSSRAQPSSSRAQSNSNVSDLYARIQNAMRQNVANGITREQTFVQLASRLAQHRGCSQSAASAELRRILDAGPSGVARESPRKDDDDDDEEEDDESDVD